FNMLWIFDEFFYINFIIAKGSFCLGLCPFVRFSKTFFVADNPHSSSAAAEGSFNNDRVAVLFGKRNYFLQGVHRTVTSRNYRKSGKLSLDRKSTRLNSSHDKNLYAVF